MTVSEITNQYDDHRASAESLIAALRRNPEALASLNPQTLRKYATGSLPIGMRWLLQYPGLLRDLADLIEDRRSRDETTTARSLE